MEHVANDNDELSFITIGAATLNVIRYLETCEKQKEDRERKTARERADKKNPKTECDYIEHRLRELREWERRISGDKKTAR